MNGGRASTPRQRTKCSSKPGVTKIAVRMNVKYGVACSDRTVSRYEAAGRAVANMK